METLVKEKLRVEVRDLGPTYRLFVYPNQTILPASFSGLFIVLSKQALFDEQLKGVDMFGNSIYNVLKHELQTIIQSHLKNEIDGAHLDRTFTLDFIKTDDTPFHPFQKLEAEISL
jgi:hypothetical protein